VEITISKKLQGCGESGEEVGRWRLKNMRNETRKERYLSKMADANFLPFGVACTNFVNDQNVAFLARAAACFGGTEVHVIGKMPKDKDLLAYSGGHSRFMKFQQHKNPVDFLEWVRDNNVYLIAAEIADDSRDIHSIQFPLDIPIMFVVGNEMDGVPTEIIRACDLLVYIPMNGYGYCLNTSQTANVLMYEYAKQALGSSLNG
jgi:23S rRNA (guanosine2251-2'-O)-methyltransferase